jgi:hypothetical protein
MLSVVNLSVAIYECRYAECHYADCRYAECRGAEHTASDPEIKGLNPARVMYHKTYYSRNLQFP